MNYGEDNRENGSQKIPVRRERRKGISSKERVRVVGAREIITAGTIRAIICVVLALPFGGFVLGFIECSDCGVNILGRALVGMIFAFFTTISGGFPPKDFAYGEQYNAWPYIYIATPLFYILLMIIWWRRASRRRKRR
jgi:hypothetical protein